MKFNIDLLENRIFYLCPNVAGFLKNVLNDRSELGTQRTFEKENFKDEHIELARSRNCGECGSDEEMRWLALHPSSY